MQRDSNVTESFLRTCRRPASWISRLQTAAVILAASALFLGCAASRQEQMHWENFGNQTYPSEWTASGYAPLKNGTYREPAAPGSASEIIVRMTEHHVFGNLEGRPSAAVVLVTDPGGSGSFYNLALLQRLDHKWEVVQHIRLGDRIRVTSLGFGENGIIMDMITHGPGDPMCCPTRKSSTRFLLKEGRLQQMIPRLAMPLTGRIWKWHGTINPKAGDTTPKHPENYTIEFLNSGLVRIVADCNSAGGGFMVHKNRISIDVAYSTMAACPPSSLEHIFTRDLLAADQFYIHENQLHLKLTEGSGKMIFSP